MNAINAQDERLAYLSFYQAIEYFFVRAQNNSFLKEFSSIDTGNVNHTELVNSVRLEIADAVVI